MMNVQKRDGGIEAWNLDKLINSIAKSGIDINEAENLALKIEKWLKKNHKESVISSQTIREKVAELMVKKYPMQAGNYEGYSRS